MNLLKLKVVLWKNLIIRKRHWLLTIFETLLPVTIFFLIAYARSQIKGLHKIKVEFPTYNELSSIEYNTINGHLLYVPQSEFYDNIIHKVVVKFQIQSDSKYIIIYIFIQSKYFGFDCSVKFYMLVLSV